jgi:predicted polyphosphate/ATP-dependent NAD kinase
MPTLGLVVNPIAGMGGRVALRGTDGPETLREARARGAKPVAGERARRALVRLPREIRVVAAPGAMGADLAAAAGLRCETTGALRVSWPDGAETTAADTWAAAAEMRARGVDLLLFAGGDGTARDIHDAIGADLPLVGVPTGVKMHSGVFAATPDAAGTVAATFLRASGSVTLRDAEIADVDEDAARAGRAAARLYGSVRVPREPALMVPAKAASPVHHQAALEALCEDVAAKIAGGGSYLLGPGTTMARVLDALGERGTLLGVDAVADGHVVAADLDEAGILERLAQAPDTRLLLGVIGGQGSLLGRGNQQLSPRVLRRLGAERIDVLAAADKLLALDPPVLRLDTGDDELDRVLSGYRRVRTGPRETIVMKVST